MLSIRFHFVTAGMVSGTSFDLYNVINVTTIFFLIILNVLQCSKGSWIKGRTADGSINKM